MHHIYEPSICLVRWLARERGEKKNKAKAKGISIVVVVFVLKTRLFARSDDCVRLAGRFDPCN
jgi:hypothetical protein